MTTLFYLSSVVAIVSTILVVTRTNAVHALLYLIVSLLAVALIFYVLGAPFASALEVIIYAGAIMVLFVFVVMMLNLGGKSARLERSWMTPQAWMGPAFLSTVLLGELIYLILSGSEPISGHGAYVGSRAVGVLIFGPYLLAIELASMLLLAGLVGAYHIGSQAWGGRR